MKQKIQTWNSWRAGVTRFSMAAIAAMTANSALAIKPGEYLPADASLVVHLDSINDLDDAHPVKRIGKHPGFAQVLETLTSGGQVDPDEVKSSFQEKLEAEFGLTPEEAVKLFPGSHTLAGYLDTEPILQRVAERGLSNGGAMDMNWNLILLSETTMTPERFRELLESSLAFAKERRPERNPELIPADGPSSFDFIEMKDGEESSTRFTLVDDLLLVEFGNVENDFSRSVNEYAGGEGDPAVSLASSRSFIDSMEYAEESGSDFFVFSPLGDLMRTVEAVVEAGLEQAQNQEGANPMLAMIPKDGAMTFLGLSNVDKFFMSGKTTPDGLDMVTEVNLAERTGLIGSIFSSYNLDQPVAYPALSTGAVEGVAVTSYDLPALLNGVLDKFNTLSPMLGGLVQMQLQQLTPKFGVDIQKDIIGSVGSEMVELYGYGEDNPTKESKPVTAYSLALADPQAFQASLGTLLEKLGMAPQTREFGGVTIYSVPKSAKLGQSLSNGGGDSLEYAFVGDSLLLSAGSADFTQKIITATNDPQSALSSDAFLTEPIIPADVPGTQIGVSHLQFPLFAKMIILSMTEGKDAKLDPDILSQLPTFEDLDFVIRSESKDTGEGIVSFIKLEPNP